MSRCFHCFKEVQQDFDVCPYCGEKKIVEPKEIVYLYPGTILAGKYIIGTVVGSGGFGVIYRAWDMHHEVVVAIKEFYYSNCMNRIAGEPRVNVFDKTREEYIYRKNRFLAEAQAMAKVASHKNTIYVFDQFEENNTAYIVMELLEGLSLKEYIREQRQALDVPFAIYVTNEVGNALNALHKNNIIHKDVAPDNIYVCSKDLRVKLYDFGAARLPEDGDNVTDKIKKCGYTPVEQYVNSDMGPWTDVYALGATLYYMVTNIRLDESTARKIEDKTKEPKDINPNVSENLSNAIMKAISVDHHMRYQDVTSFLKAVNGEKKAISLEKERKRRRARRWNGILAMLLVVLLIGGVVWGLYNKSKSEGRLEDASIEIWYEADAGSDEIVAMQTIVEDFEEKYPNVEITLRNYSSDEYEDVLRNAAATNNLPDLYESTGISGEIIEHAVSLEKVLDTSYAKKCNFLEQYSAYYSDTKKLPIAFEIPVVFVINNGATSNGYTKKTFSKLTDICSENQLAYDIRYDEMLSKNFNIGVKNSTEGFFNTQGNTLAVMVSSSTEIESLRSEFWKYYEWSWSYYDSEKIFGAFTYEWSIADNGDNELEAAERFLSMMLGNEYQDVLMVSTANEGQLPLNSNALENKCESNNSGAKSYYDQVMNLISKIFFER